MIQFPSMRGINSKNSSVPFLAMTKELIYPQACYIFVQETRKFQSPDMEQKYENAGDVEAVGMYTVRQGR